MYTSCKRNDAVTQPYVVRTWTSKRPGKRIVKKRKMYSTIRRLIVQFRPQQSGHAGQNVWKMRNSFDICAFIGWKVFFVCTYRVPTYVQCNKLSLSNYKSKIICCIQLVLSTIKDEISPYFRTFSVFVQNEIPVYEISWFISHVMSSQVRDPRRYSLFFYVLITFLDTFEKSHFSKW